MTVDAHGQWVFEFDRPIIHLLTPDEIYARADEALLRQLVEDYRLEVKPNGMHSRALGDYFSMWANTAPTGGLIMVGVRDDKTWEGCAKKHPDFISELELTGEVYCPDAVYTVKRVEIRRDKDGESDFVLLFRVKYHPTRVVRTTSGHVYVRRANRKKELRTPDEIHQLQSEKGEVRFETEPIGLKYPADFDLPSLTSFTGTVRAKREWDDYHTTEDILQHMNLGTGDSGKFVPNVACALLFANNPRLVVPGCRVRFLRFEGESEGVGDKWNAVKDEVIDGTVPTLIEQTGQLIASQLRTFSRLDRAGRFFTAREYPDFAWHEAVVNACAHRSYGNGMRTTPVTVKMFDDRLVVESPGPFPPFVNPANFHAHVPRNPFLMDAMYFMKFVKCAREGTRRMMVEMKEMDLPAPEWKQEELEHALVRVTLRNNVRQRRAWVDSDVVQMLGAQLAQSLKEGEKRCINFCAENGRINVSDAQRLNGWHWRAARNSLMSMVEKGILDHIHSEKERDPDAHFVIKGTKPKPASRKPRRS